MVRSQGLGGYQPSQVTGWLPGGILGTPNCFMILPAGVRRPEGAIGLTRRPIPKEPPRHTIDSLHLIRTGPAPCTHHPMRLQPIIVHGSRWLSGFAHRHPSPAPPPAAPPPPGAAPPVSARCDSVAPRASPRRWGVPLLRRRPPPTWRPRWNPAKATCRPTYCICMGTQQICDETLYPVSIRC